MVPRSAREISEFVDRAQDVADALGDLFAELRQPDLPRASLEQHAAQGFLEFPDLHRQRRLRDRGCFRRASEVAMTRQYVKITQLFERNMTHQNILLQRSKESTLPDRLRCVETRNRVESIKTTTEGGEYG